MASPKYSAWISPVGIAKKCWVNKPSKPFDGKGPEQYKITLVLEDTPELREKIDEIMAKAVKEAKTNKVKIKKVYQTPFKYPEDVDEDDFIPEEGKQYPKLDEDFRDKIFFETKSQFKPGLIDSKNQSLPEDVFPFNGDKVRVKVEFNPYEGFGSGISFRLKTVQLVEKNTSFDHAPDIDGFDEIEDGYVAPSQEEEEDF